ncbi:MAG: glycosyltransferase family 4 protein [Bacteroidales bacterium]|nr:glycosyltransferase family 4 protein [Bacteroidales bacterium]
MILGVDASNIRTGGGITHLTELLNAVEPDNYGFEKVILWSSKSTLYQLQNYEWLIKETHHLLDKSFVHSFYWQIFLSGKSARKLGCSLLFVPGGSYIGSFRPFVTMCRNMLPFEWIEILRFKSWIVRLRFLILRFVQITTFRNADGLIFLTKYARGKILPLLGKKPPIFINIPHGINSAFSQPPKTQKFINEYSLHEPFRILYVSVITEYKHQWNVVKAVYKLRKEGLHVVLDLVGPAYKPAYKQLQKVIKETEGADNFIYYHGSKQHSELSDFYKRSDAFIYASSCENMPNILIEAMSAGLPIASSDKGPMPEILNEAGIFFNPLDVNEIYLSLKELAEKKEKRQELAEKSFRLAKEYSWEKCAQETFSFLKSVVINVLKS